MIRGFYQKALLYENSFKNRAINTDDRKDYLFNN